MRLWLRLRHPHTLHSPITPIITRILLLGGDQIPLTVIPAVTDVIVRHMTVLLLASALQVFVAGGGRVRVFGYDVPGVEKAGDETKGAEEDVDEGIEGAKARFDPDCWVLLDRLMNGFAAGEEGKVPGRGGKITARRARRMSAVQHIIGVLQADDRVNLTVILGPGGCNEMKKFVMERESRDS